MLGIANDHARLRVREEIVEFAALVAGVERQIDEARAQAGQIERQRLPVLVGLHRDTVALAASGGDQRMCNPRGHRLDVVVMDDPSVRNDKQRLLRAVGEVGFEQRVEVGIHFVRNVRRRACAAMLFWS